LANDPRFAAGQVVKGRLICGAKNKKADPCGLSPVPGATRCGRHGGKAPQVQAKARERIVEENARGILGRIDPTAPQEHPVETLLKLINMKLAEVLWLRSKVQELEEADLVWGRAQHEVGEGPEGPIDKHTFKADQNIWWKLLREAENQLASWTAAAAKAGVEERQIRMNETLAMQFKTAIDQILNRMELTPAQVALVPHVVPAVLRSMSTL
jgi:hypothetical protein